MITVNKKKKVVLNCPRRCGTIHNPWAETSLTCRDVVEIGIHELPLYRHNYTRILVLHHPASWLGSVYKEEVFGKTASPSTKTFAEWWEKLFEDDPLTGEYQSGYSSHVKAPCEPEYRDRYGKIETDIIVDGAQRAGWYGSLSTALDLNMMVTAPIAPVPDYDNLDVHCPIDSPTLRQKFYGVYGSDIEDYNGLDSQPFIVA